jgi:hypothetical protein
MASFSTEQVPLYACISNSFSCVPCPTLEKVTLMRENYGIIKNTNKDISMFIDVCKNK